MAAEALVERVSFAGGEAGRALRARADLARYQISLQAMENYVVMVEGGATRRPGTFFSDRLKVESERGKFIPFRFSDFDAYMLVINGMTVRFLRHGGFLQSAPGVPYEVAVPWREVDLPNLRTVARGNVIFAACREFRIHTITRLGLVDWQVAEFLPKGGPFEPQNLNTSDAILATGTTGIVTITSTNPIFTSQHALSLWRVDESTLSLIAEWTAESAVTTGELRRFNGNVYEVISGTNTGVNPPTHTEGDVQTDAGMVWRYRHGPFGLFRILQVNSSTNVSASVEKTLPDSVTSVLSYRYWPPAWFDGSWPTLLAWSGQRLWYFRGDRFWASALTDPQNLEETGDDDGAFSGKILSPEPYGALVDILWAINSGVLILGTSDIEWRIASAAGGGSTVVTAKTVDPTPETKEGSIPHIPVLVDDGVIFVGKSGFRLNRVKIDLGETGSNRLGSDEPSVGARHIFMGGPRVMGWQRDPQRVLWIAMLDGTLAGLTWMERQKVLAAHRHPLVNGAVEDVAVIPGAVGARGDEVYFIVRRTISGVTRRYIEVMAPYFEPAAPAVPGGEQTAVGAWYVDCGLASDFPSAVTVVGGLSHLEGQEVAIFADGAMQSRKVVVGGQITLDRPAKLVTVGLPIRAELLDLPRNVATAGGPTTGQEKAAREVNLHVQDCAGGLIGTLPKTGELPMEEIVETGGKAYHTPIILVNGLLRKMVECDIEEEVQLRIINDDPMPCTILGFSPRIEIEETE